MIYLIRHGKTDWNNQGKIQGCTNTLLNQEGKKQAEIISEKIKNLSINKIYASDLDRAKETANIINKKIGTDIILDKRLREVSYGDFEGVDTKVFTDDMWEVFKRTPEKAKGESRINVYNRIKEFLEEIENKDENILIVTHGGIIRMMLYYADNTDNFDIDEYAKHSTGKWYENLQVIELKIKK